MTSWDTEGKCSYFYFMQHETVYTANKGLNIDKNSESNFCHTTLTSVISCKEKNEYLMWSP